MNLVRMRSVVGVCLLVAFIGVVSSPEAVAAATCNTFDAGNVPTTAFRGGDKIVVRGTGFAANSVVLVNLLQGNRTIELDRVRANDLGAFALTDATVPGTVADGEAAIRALDARGSATCALTLSAGEGSESSLGGLFWVWGVVLALFGGVLALLTYRRWKAERLREAVDSLAWREQYEQREVAEPVAVGSRVSAVGSTDPLPSWTADTQRPADEQRLSWTDEQRPSWVTDGPRPSWARSDDDNLASEPFEPSAGRVDEQIVDEPLSWTPVQHRSAPQRPVPERHQSVRPAADDAWRLDDDDDLSPIGAPRPFDDRFALDENVRPARRPEASLRDDRTHDDEPDDDQPMAFRPPSIDDVIEPRSEPAPAVESRRAPQQPWSAPDPIEDDPWHEAPLRAHDPEVAVAGADEALAAEPGAEPFESVTPQPTHAPPVPESAAPEPVAPPRPAAARSVPEAPAAPGVHAERDFAAVLREFLDNEEMELDRRSGAANRPGRLRPVGGLRPEDAGRIPQGAVQPSAPAPVQPPAERHGPVRPLAPLAPSLDDAAAEPSPSRASSTADEPLGDDAWRPRGDRPVEPRLQPGPMPDVAPPPVRPSPPVAPPQAPVRLGSEWEASRRPPAPEEGWDVQREPSAAQWEAPARPGADPVAFDPVQRPTGARAPETREPERPVHLETTDPGRPRVGADDDVSEPPVLPVGWDEGRLKPPVARASDAIARLRREVRNWKR